MAKRLEVIKTYKLYINGAFPRSESGRSLAIEDSKGKTIAHISHGSRKDLRDAVEAANAAQPKWAAATAYNRAQVLYRMAEMMEGKRDEFIDALKETSKRQNVETSKEKSKSRKGDKRNQSNSRGWQPAVELDACIDRLVCFAGWADKYAQVLGCNNPVAGPFYNFTVPEPTGVVGVISPDENAPALLGLISLLAPPLCAGNAVVAIADEAGGGMIPASIFGEVCATSDVPPGVINIITGKRAELLDHLARHRNINAISAANLPRDASTQLRLGVAENLKRVRIAKIATDQWLDPEVCESPQTIEPFVEMKTIWHPAAV